MKLKSDMVCLKMTLLSTARVSQCALYPQLYMLKFLFPMYCCKPSRFHLLFDFAKFTNAIKSIINNSVKGKTTHFLSMHLCTALKRTGNNEFAIFWTLYLTN